MDIKAEILKEHSKRQALKIAAYIGHAPGRFKELMLLFLGDEYRVTQRTAWVLGFCFDQDRDLIKPYVEDLIHNLDRPVPDAVKRNTLRLLQHLEVPGHLQGKLADSCFGFLTSAEPVAIKAFSMTVLANLARHYPDLIGELEIVLEDQLPYASAGFASRANKVLGQVAKMKKTRR